MSTTFSARHLEARRLALLDIPVFPCIPGTKFPATPGGHNDASADVEQIDAWWSAADYNLAFVPESTGLCVVDLDGQEAVDAWEELQIEHGQVTPTKTIQTPRGAGYHLYFKGHLPPSVGKLGPHIDTRGGKSYVLLPPSVIDGNEYKQLSDCEAAKLPGWIQPILDAYAKEHINAAENVVLDTPAAISRATALLEGYAGRGNVAVEGQNGDNKTYSVACEVLNLGLTAGAAFELIRDLWNPHCIPPWDVDELGVKIDNASRYAQNEAGAWAVESAQEVFGEAVSKLPGTSSHSPRSDRFHVFMEDEQDKMRDPSWIIRDLIPDESVVMLYGPQGSYKSFLALDIGLTLASGKAGWGRGDSEPLPVVYAAAEGPRSVSRQRRPAWRLAKSIEGSIPFGLITGVPFFAYPQLVDEFLEAIKRSPLPNPKLVVLDTLARAMAGMNENDTRDASLAVEAIGRIQREFRCSVLLVHHAGKDESRGARGSSAFMAGVDAAHEVKAHKATQAVEVFCRRQKDADERETSWTFQGKTIASSLVFFETSAKEHRLLTASEDVFEPKKIGAALAHLDAYGTEKGVTTTVLAFHLVPPMEGQSVEEHSEIAMKAARSLRALAKGRLEAYCERVGRDLLWFLPS